MTTVKVEVHGGKERHVDIPEGWKQVPHGQGAERGDKFYNLGTHRFHYVMHEDIGDLSQNFNLLIREINPEKSP